MDPSYEFVDDYRGHLRRAGRHPVASGASGEIWRGRDEPGRRVDRLLSRRVARNGECASDLAVAAATHLFDSGIDRREIDLILFATQTPDYLLPTTACILQDRLGLSTDVAAFDINLGCSQYLYALATAHAYVTAGLARKALVLTGDTVSRTLHAKDRSVVPLFGDAGSATLVEPSAGGAGFETFCFGTDGSGANALIWPASGLRMARSAQTAIEKTDRYGATRTDEHMFMDGRAIYLFTLKVVPRLVNGLLGKAGIQLDDVDLFVFHQASKLIVESAVRKLKLPPEKCLFTVQDLGNSGGTTVAIALATPFGMGA